jgi:hypothetical protein
MEPVVCSYSSVQRAKRALSTGDKAHCPAPHPILNEQESTELIDLIVNLPDTSTQPLVADLPMLVYYCFFLKKFNQLSFSISGIHNTT